ncbi:MAG: rod-binding protein [Ferrovibrio sp.]
MSAVANTPHVNSFGIEQAQADRAKLGKLGNAKDDPRKTAQEFEAFFLSQMFEAMSAGVKTDGPLGGGQAEANWRSFLNDEYGKTMSKGRGIGIANMVYDQMLKLQEARS